jgi:hypothetical protein
VRSPNPNRRPNPNHGVDLGAAYAKLASGHRIGGTTHYREPEVLRTVQVPNGGKLELQALRPYDTSEPIIRWVATYVAGGAHCTTERYLQIPHHGFDVLEGGAATRQIEADCRQMIENIERERLRAAQP